MPNNNYQTSTLEHMYNLSAPQGNYFNPQEHMRQQVLPQLLANNLYAKQGYLNDSFSEVMSELENSAANSSYGYSMQESVFPSESGYQYWADFENHSNNFQSSLVDVENFDKSSLFDVKHFNEKCALHNERGALALELKGFEQLTEKLESSYTSKKASLYNKTNFVTSFFSDPKPSQDRLDSIANIQKVVKLVRDDLSSLKVQPSLFNAEDAMMAMKYQVHHLQQAIFAIKGAALNESSKISDSYNVLPASRSAMHNVLQSTYNCSQMSAQEKVDSTSAFSKFESKMEANERIAAESEKDQPQALVL